MGDAIDGLRAQSLVTQLINSERRAAAGHEYGEAYEIAKANGLRLVKRSDAHYQLINGYILNLYPGNQRIYRDKSKPQSPFFKFQGQWTLLDVVKAAVLWKDMAEQEGGGK